MVRIVGRGWYCIWVGWRVEHGAGELVRVPREYRGGGYYREFHGEGGSSLEVPHTHEAIHPCFMSTYIHSRHLHPNLPTSPSTLPCCPAAYSQSLHPTSHVFPPSCLPAAFPSTCPKFLPGSITSLTLLFNSFVSGNPPSTLLSQSVRVFVDTRRSASPSSGCSVCAMADGLLRRPDMPCGVDVLAASPSACASSGLSVCATAEGRLPLLVGCGSGAGCSVSPLPAKGAFAETDSAGRGGEVRASALVVCGVAEGRRAEVEAREERGKSGGPSSSASAKGCSAEVAEGGSEDGAAEGSAVMWILKVPEEAGRRETSPREASKVDRSSWAYCGC